MKDSITTKAFGWFFKHASAISSLRDLKYVFKNIVWPPNSNSEKHAISKQQSKQTTNQLWLKSQQQLIGNHQLKFALHHPGGSINHHAQEKIQAFMVFL